MTVTMEKQNEIPLSLRQISELPDVKERITYGTLRTYVVRYRDKGFPEAATKNIAGNGQSWFPSEIIFFLKNMPDNRGSKNHKDKSARAKLGHKNRQIRQKAECVLCFKQIPAGDYCIEYTPDNQVEIELYHEKCAIIKGVWQPDGS